LPFYPNRAVEREGQVNCWDRGRPARHERKARKWS